MTTQRERVAKNKKAFDEIIGDPFSKHDIVGQYVTLRTKSSVKAIDNSIENQSMQGSSGNAARPNVVDFLCDVDSAVFDGLGKYTKHQGAEWNGFVGLVNDFTATYITQEGEYIKQRQRAEIEQIIGQILIARKISPAIRYFTALRQRKVKEGK